MNRTFRAASAAMLTIFVALTGSVATAQSPSDLSVPPWTLVSIDGTPVPAGVTATATFTQDGHVLGSAGCNDFNGTYTVNGSSVTVGTLSSTRMFCDEATMGVEQGFLAALETATSFSLADGELTINSADGSVLVMTKGGASVPIGSPAPSTAPPPSGGPSVSPIPPNAANIVGPTWRLVTIAGQDISQYGGLLSPITLTFGADGKVTGNGGCNDYAADYSLAGSTLTITNLKPTTNTCTQVSDMLEGTYFLVLPFVTSATLADGVLTLSNTASSSLDATFTAG